MFNFSGGQREWDRKHILKNPNKSFIITGEKERKGADDGRYFLPGEGNIKQFLSVNLYFLFKIVVEDI